MTGDSVQPAPDDDRSGRDWLILMLLQAYPGARLDESAGGVMVWYRDHQPDDQDDDRT